LYGTALKSVLENIFTQYYSDTMIKKLGPVRGPDEGVQLLYPPGFIMLYMLPQSGAQFRVVWHPLNIYEFGLKVSTEML
jgi:hypothetical protein